MIKLTVKSILSGAWEDIDNGTEVSDYTNIEGLQSDINKKFPLSYYSIFFDDDTDTKDIAKRQPMFIATDINDDTRIYHITIEGIDPKLITFKL